MKILIVIPGIGYGGAETLVLEWIHYWLQSAEVEKIILVLYSDKYIHRLEHFSNNAKFKFEIEKTNEPWKICRLRYLLHLLKLRKIIQKHNPDVIQSNLVANIDLAFISRWLPKVKCIVPTEHGPTEKTAPKWYYRFGIKRFYKNNNCHVVAISKFVEESIRKSYNAKSTLIYNGAIQPIQTDSLNSVQREIQILKHSCSLDDKKVFIAVGRVAPPKNYEMMTRVFQRLYIEKANVILIVLGNLLNDENRAKYLPMAQQNIFFLDKKDNVGDYLRCADFYCMTSHYEGLPVSAVEAISVGLIPVITPTVGLSEVIPSAEHGVISVDMNEDSFYQAVQTALSLSEKERKKIMENNYKWYEDKFTLGGCAEAYLSLFRKKVK